MSGLACSHRVYLLAIGELNKHIYKHVQCRLDSGKERVTINVGTKVAKARWRELGSRARVPRG